LLYWELPYLKVKWDFVMYNNIGEYHSKSV
jgi:hypothetical protein